MLQNTTLGEIPNVAHTLPMLPKNTTKIGDTIVATHLKGASPLLHPNVACNIGKKHATMGTFVPCVLGKLPLDHGTKRFHTSKSRYTLICLVCYL